MTNEGCVNRTYCLLNVGNIYVKHCCLFTGNKGLFSADGNGVMSYGDVSNYAVGTSFDSTMVVSGWLHIHSYIQCSKMCTTLRGHAIPSFRYGDKTVHLYERSPYLVGIFMTFN